ncbi:unnamed protein product, partial [Polarella glacialis]
VALDCAKLPLRLLLVDSVADTSVFATLEVPKASVGERPLALLLGRSEAAFQSGSPGRGGSSGPASSGGSGVEEWCSVLELGGAVHCCAQVKTVPMTVAVSPWDIFVHLSCGQQIDSRALEASKGFGRSIVTPSPGSRDSTACIRMRLPLRFASGQEGPFADFLQWCLAPPPSGEPPANSPVAPRPCERSGLAWLAKIVGETCEVAALRAHVVLPPLLLEGVGGSDDAPVQLPRFDAGVHLEHGGLVDGFVVGLHNLRHFAVMLGSIRPRLPKETPRAGASSQPLPRAAYSTPPVPLQALEQAPPLSLAAGALLTALAVVLAERDSVFITYLGDENTECILNQGSIFDALTESNHPIIHFRVILHCLGSPFEVEHEQLCEQLKSSLKQEELEAERLEAKYAAQHAAILAKLHEAGQEQSETQSAQQQALGDSQLLQEQAASTQASASTEATGRARLDGRCSALEKEARTLQEKLQAALAAQEAESEASQRLREESGEQHLKLAELRQHLEEMSDEIGNLQAERDHAFSELKVALLQAEALKTGSTSSSARRPSLRKARRSSGGVSSALKGSAVLAGTANLEPEASEASTKASPPRSRRTSQKSARPTPEPPRSEQKEQLEEQAAAAPEAHWGDDDSSSPEASAKVSLTTKLLAATAEASAMQIEQESLTVSTSPPPEELATQSLSKSVESGEQVVQLADASLKAPKVPDVRSDPSAEVFRFDFSVFEFLGHEALKLPPDSHFEVGGAVRVSAVKEFQQEQQEQQQQQQPQQRQRGPDEQEPAESEDSSAEDDPQQHQQQQQQESFAPQERQQQQQQQHQQQQQQQYLTESLLDLPPRSPEPGSGPAAPSYGWTEDSQTSSTVSEVYEFFAAALEVVLTMGFPLHRCCLPLAAWSGSVELLRAAAEGASHREGPAASRKEAVLLSSEAQRDLVTWAARGAYANPLPRQSKVLRWLVQQKARLDQPDQAGRTVLDWACWAGSEELVESLLRRSDAPLLSPPGGDSSLQETVQPLIMAVAGRSQKVVAMLLRAAGDPHASPPGSTDSSTNGDGHGCSEIDAQRDVLQRIDLSALLRVLAGL